MEGKKIGKETTTGGKRLIWPYSIKRKAWKGSEGLACSGEKEQRGGWGFGSLPCCKKLKRKVEGPTTFWDRKIWKKD